MENSMLKRLEATKVRLVEVDKELLDENVMRDRKKFRDLNKEHAVIDTKLTEERIVTLIYRDRTFTASFFHTMHEVNV